MRAYHNCLLLALIGFYCGCSKVEKDSPLDSITIITAESKVGKSLGSGFVAEIEGKKYLISNQHNFYKTESYEIRSLNDELIQPISFEVCRNRDLVRMQITNDIPALSLHESIPSINEHIFIYGNSKGGGVATEIEGSILGVGPALIEVNAKFVAGNSGCPILNSDFDVVGVATFATLYNNPNDWVSKGTRFQGIRRYGVRLNNAEWLGIPYETFTKQSEMISDSEEAMQIYGLSYLCSKIYVHRSVSLNDYYHDNEFSARIDKWKKLCERLFLYEPDTNAFFSESIYSKCNNLYRKADRLHSALDEKYIEDSLGREYIETKRSANKNNSELRSESSKLIKTLRENLESEEWVSAYLQEKADKLIELCDYVLE